MWKLQWLNRNIVKMVVSKDEKRGIQMKIATNTYKKRERNEYINKMRIEYDCNSNGTHSQYIEYRAAHDKTEIKWKSKAIQ